MSVAETLTWPFFRDEHRSFANKVGRWAQAEVPKLAEGDIESVSRNLVKGMGAAGLLDVVVPQEGERFDVRSICLAREILAFQHGAADVSFAMQGLGSGPVSLAGSQELKRRYLPAVRAGRSIPAFALSEPEAGSDVAALATTAVPDGSTHVRISGRKTWITNGGIADFYVVFARTGEASGARGLSAFVVDADAPGFKVLEQIEVIAPHPLATIEFDEMRVPVANRLGGPGEGFKVAMSNLDIFRSTVGAAATGFARRALHEAVKHAKSRKLFGAPLGDLQFSQGAIADSAAEIDAAALLVYRSAWVKDTTARRVTREAAIAKMYATEAAQRVVDRAVQLHGGLGVTRGVKVEELYRDVRALRIYEGATEVQKIIIARDILKGDG